MFLINMLLMKQEQKLTNHQHQRLLTTLSRWNNAPTLSKFLRRLYRRGGGGSKKKQLAFCVVKIGAIILSEVTTPNDDQS